jgi:hypothetical protein
LHDASRVLNERRKTGLSVDGNRAILLERLQEFVDMLDWEWEVLESKAQEVRSADIAVRGRQNACED